MSFCLYLGISDNETTDKFILEKKLFDVRIQLTIFSLLFQILNSCWMKIIIQYQCPFMLLQAIRVKVLMQTELKTKKDTGGTVYLLFLFPRYGIFQNTMFYCS